MKKLIIISAALMAFALLCGAIDFAKETRNGKLAKIYEDKKSEMISSIKKNAEAISKKKEVKKSQEKIIYTNCRLLSSNTEQFSTNQWICSSATFKLSVKKC